MKYKIINSRITDENIITKIKKQINLDDYDKDYEYDIDIDYYNFDLIEDKLNADVIYEIKKSHYMFLKQLRDYFIYIGININEINLIGTVSKIVVGDINLDIQKSKYQSYKRNNIVPCKEILLYDDSKKTLDILLLNEQITEEEYKRNIGVLQEELDITEIEDESGYIN